MAVLNDEQTMLRDMVREWSDNESPVTAFRKMRAAAPSAGYDAAAWQALSEMGVAGIVIPEAFGGTAFGYLSLGLVLEQLGRNLAASPLAATSAAASAIVLGESETAKAEWLPRIASGAVVATLAVDEGPVHDPAKVATKVVDGRLSGTKAFVAEGDSAGVFVVAADDGLYLVSGDVGVTRSPRHMTDSRSHAQITFADAPAERLGDTALTARVVDRATAAVCAEMLGLAVQAFNTTNDYLKTRVQFGQVLSTFQALQHRMAKMFTELELMRSAVEGALEAIDAGRSDVDQAVSLAKAVAGDTLHLVSREMIQLHGGIGMTDEHDAGFYIKRARILETMWGNAAFHRERFARLNGY
ncbi:alkylation response protein AidB-like acyl-CoA dehydrogenase [Sphingomonas sp. BE270]|jgi:alkylation response protein AidB-like acyl-CoA dehydrogenase|uniref:acyl-CoA dehydrogenase family protein n=1 Tax=unclassified Sphingomonas TaxID=196159 RepID=UPI00053DA22B|nr:MULTISPECIES: acyl-CoA dehydrogenase family protein [unclassified Sphingomonas]MDR6849382.1 alkylation response protein AidB-like acyl-CoA dehydrogenase [Sphingomonas sp. BE137]MDR7257484.1 alkylation response protein AidB-like acyl-CoA dehydrogenase [Sphingomonas sp. BE270]